MLEHAVILDLVIEGAKCEGMYCLWIEGEHSVSSAGAAVAHDISNCMIIDESCGESTVAARCVEVFKC